MITVLIVVITTLFSIVAFRSSRFFNSYKFNPYAVKHNKQWFRAFTYAVIHVDWIHLMVNMLVLLSFGKFVEYAFKIYFPTDGWLLFVLLYMGGILISVLPSYKKHKDDIYYNSVGASGAVSAIVFSSIILNPMASLQFMFIPINIPAILFGVFYLIYSAYMAKRAKDNIGHDAHLYGALFGMLYTIVIDPKLIIMFYNQISLYLNNL